MVYNPGLEIAGLSPTRELHKDKKQESGDRAVTHPYEPTILSMNQIPQKKHWYISWQPPFSIATQLVREKTIATYPSSHC